MKAELIPYRLLFKHPFKIAHGARAGTDVVYLRLTHDGVVAWGEATLPPYLPETQKSVIDFITGLNIEGIGVPFDPVEVFTAIEKKHTGNYAAKAALDMALWHLKAQLEHKTMRELLDVPVSGYPLCTYTLGASGFEAMRRKVNEADEYGFELLKIKLTGEDDIAGVENLRKLTHKPFAIDVNQGWKTLAQARHNLREIAEFEPVLVEQPLPVGQEQHMRDLLREFQIAFYADESCQTADDLETLPDYFDGVDIKLMKCGGITPALAMIERARDLGISVLIGCMSESSVGCTAAAHLTPLADYADLDGPYLIGNDPFKGMTVEKGRVRVHELVKVADL